MLIKLHSKCAVNPINVAAVVCGQMAITVRLTNGRAHNLECRGKDSCPQLYGNIVNALMHHIAMISVAARELTVVNVDHVLSIAEITPGIAVNMAGDFVVTVPAGMSSKPEQFNRIVKQLEAFK